MTGKIRATAKQFADSLARHPTHIDIFNRGVPLVPVVPSSAKLQPSFSAPKASLTGPGPELIHLLETSQASPPRQRSKIVGILAEKVPQVAKVDVSPSAIRPSATRAQLRAQLRCLYDTPADRILEMLAKLDVHHSTLPELRKATHRLPTFDFSVVGEIAHFQLSHIHSGSSALRSQVENGLEMKVAVKVIRGEDGLVYDQPYRPNYSLALPEDNEDGTLPFFDVTLVSNNGKEKVLHGSVLGVVSNSRNPSSWKQRFPECFLQDWACFLDEDKQLWGLISIIKLQQKGKKHEFDSYENVTGLPLIMRFGGSTDNPAETPCTVNFGTLETLQKYRIKGAPMSFSFQTGISAWKSRQITHLDFLTDASKVSSG